MSSLQFLKASSETRQGMFLYHRGTLWICIRECSSTFPFNTSIKFPFLSSSLQNVSIKTSSDILEQDTNSVDFPETQCLNSSGYTIQCFHFRHSERLSSVLLSLLTFVIYIYCSTLFFSLQNVRFLLKDSSSSFILDNFFICFIEKYEFFSFWSGWRLWK